MEVLWTASVRQIAPRSGASVPGAHEIWCALFAPGLPARGEAGGGGRIRQEQFPQTLASLLGLTYKADHPVSPKFDLFAR